MDKRLPARIRDVVQEMRESKQPVTVDTVCEALRGKFQEYARTKLQNLKSTVSQELSAARVRTRMSNIEYFSPTLRGARSRLYRRRFLQVNTPWKDLAEIYTTHSFAPFFNLNISTKNDD